MFGHLNASNQWLNVDP